MSDKGFFDTNVLVSAVTDSNERTAEAEALVAGGGVISVQVLNELASVARRKLGMTWDEAGEMLGLIRTLCPSPVAVTIETHDAALRIAAQYGLHLYDALIAAAALAAGCTTLYTEDLQNGQVIDGRLTIRSPFTA